MKWWSLKLSCFIANIDIFNFLSFQKQAENKRALRKIQEEMEKRKNELSIVQNEASVLSNQLVRVVSISMHFY